MIRSARRRAGYLATTAAFAVLSLLPRPALAQAAGAEPFRTAPAEGPADPRDAEIAALRTELRELAREVADLKAATDNAQRVASATRAATPKAGVIDGRPQLVSADGQVKVALRTIMQFDAANYHTSPLTAANELASGTDFRRARIGIDGTDRDWNFALWGDFGASGGEAPGLNQAWVEYAGFKPAGLANPIFIRAGAWAPPAGLEDATPNTEGLFLERPGVAELARTLDAGDGRTGIGATNFGAHWFAEAILTGKVVGVPTTPVYAQQAGFLTRIAVDPFHGADFDTHLGASVQGVLKPANTAAGGAVSDVIRLNEPPELRVANTSLVDTGSIPASRETTYGLEAGASWRNLYAAGEWFKFDIDRTALVAAPSPFDPSLSGWYLQGAWTITGERHVWTPNTGGFRGIVQPLHPFDPANGGWGGWELAARYTVLDLNDDAGAPSHATPIGGVRGGEQDITTVGVNFYPNSLLRFLLDYQSADIKRLSSAGANAGEHENAVSARAQFTF